MSTIKLMDQSRWDVNYGTETLKEVAVSPESFILDVNKLPSHQKFLLKMLPDLNGRRVLEFGTGQGQFSIALAKRGAKCVGIDIGPQLITVARKLAELNEVDCEFCVGSIHELPFEDGTFDYVVGNAILHHLPKEGVISSLQEAHRVLKPGGNAYFSEPIENSQLFDFVQNLIPVGIPGDAQYRPSILERKKWYKYLAQLDHRAMTDKELIDAGAPFESVRMVYHGWTTRLARIIPGKLPRQSMEFTDRFLTHRFSPVKRFSSLVCTEYHKAQPVRIRKAK